VEVAREKGISLIFWEQKKAEFSEIPRNKRGIL
jgi:hypothetical protein